MAKARKVKPDGSEAQKASMFQTVGAMVAGIVAVKLSTYVVVTLWRLVTREDPPEVDEAVHWGKKAAWLAIIGAATGASRQAARELIKPPTSGAA